MLDVSTLSHVILRQPQEDYSNFTEWLINLGEVTAVVWEKPGFKHRTDLPPNPVLMTVALFCLSMIKNVI